MNKISKTILITLIAFFGAGFLLVLPTNATQVDELIVEYWSETENNWLPLSVPIFSETNFLPGDGITRLIRVTNNSVETQRIATESINENDPDHLGSQLNLTIKEGATIIFNNTLAKFFSQGETNPDGFGVPDVQQAVRLRRKPSMYPPSELICFKVLADNISNEIFLFF